MRILGIDHGTRRIGLAIADEDGTVAVPFGVLENKSEVFVLTELERLIREEGIGRMVIGMPFALEDGRIGSQEPMVRAFVDGLRARVSLPIETVDERFTTAEARMQAQDVPRKQRVQKDAAAAMILLQAYLDQRTR